MCIRMTNLQEPFLQRVLAQVPLIEAELNKSQAPLAALNAGHSRKRRSRRDPDETARKFRKRNQIVKAGSLVNHSTMSITHTEQELDALNDGPPSKRPKIHDQGLDGRGRPGNSTDMGSDAQAQSHYRKEPKKD
ncbi:MAG: hypothetical protein Q9211_000026 [Gyalolechia sp. 1 TL-2023]